MVGDVEIKGEENLEGAVLWQLTELTDPGIARVWRQNRQLCHTYQANVPRAIRKGTSDSGQGNLPFVTKKTEGVAW